MNRSKAFPVSEWKLDGLLRQILTMGDPAFMRNQICWSESPKTTSSDRGWPEHEQREDEKVCRTRDSKNKMCVQAEG